MVSHHWIPSSHECWGMMCFKPFEVTRPFLTPSCTNLCNGGNCSAHSLYKNLLVKNRWWLAIAQWTISTFLSLTCHLHMSNRKLRFPFFFRYWCIIPNTSNYQFLNYHAHLFFEPLRLCSLTLLFFAYTHPIMHI